MIGFFNNNLVGGVVCCVIVIDDFGCVGDICFMMDFLIGIVFIVQVDLVDCNGGNIGSIEFLAMGGILFYNYNWEKIDFSFFGIGVFNEDNEIVSFFNLIVGIYVIMIVDNFFDIVFIVVVEEFSVFEFIILS